MKKKLNNPKLLLLFLIAMLPLSVNAITPQASMKLFAVTTEGTGISADLTITLEKGNGKVYTSVFPLVGTSTQNTEKLSVEVAKNYFSKTKDYDYKFDINSTAGMVDGPSAGSAMTLLLISMLQDKNLAKEVGITGTITSEGGIGTVGGVFEKAKYASTLGIKLFMIPSGTSKQISRVGNELKTIDLREYALREWKMKVIEVKNIDEALKMAFTNIEKIDVNKEIQKKLPDFNPNKLDLPKNLSAMKEITTKYLKDANALLTQARIALATTSIEDNSVINALLESINDSEQTLKESQMLYEKNYLYSSANFAFIARINSLFVKDIAENPKLLTETKELETKTSELKQQLTEQKTKLSEFDSLDLLEWHVAAQERLTWALLAIEKIEETQTIVIEQDNTNINVYSNAIENIRQYEYASAWLEVSKDFYEISKNSSKKIQPNSKELQSLNEEKISEILKNNSILEQPEFEDAVRRIKAAQKQETLGWNLAKAIDSASGIALIEAQLYSKDKTREELKKKLEEKITEAESKIIKSSHKFIWAQLYLDHAKYFLEATNYYEKYNENTQAMENAKSGVSLAFLSNEILDTTEKIYSHYEKTQNTPYTQTTSKNNSSTNQTQTPENSITTSNQANTQTQPSSQQILITIAFIGIIIVAGLTFASIIITRKRTSFESSFEGREQREIMRMQRELDNKFMEEKISKEKYEYMQTRLEQRLGKLKKPTREFPTELDNALAKHSKRLVKASKEMEKTKQKLTKLKTRKTKKKK